MADKNFKVRHGLEIGNNTSSPFVSNSTGIYHTGIANVANLNATVADVTTINAVNAFISGNVGIKTTSPSVSLHVNATDAIFLPVGNSSQRPVSAANGMMRYNSELGKVETYEGGVWAVTSGGAGFYKGNFGTVGDPSNVNNLFRINANTQTANIVISAGENAMAAGPYVVATGYNLLVQTGGRVVIV